MKSLKRLPGIKSIKKLNSHISQKIYDVMTTTIKNSDSTISVLGILRDITTRKTAEEEVKKQLLEKEVILKEVHHRIKNNFASIGNLLSMQVKFSN